MPNPENAQKLGESAAEIAMKKSLAFGEAMNAIVDQKKEAPKSADTAITPDQSQEQPKPAKKAPYVNPLDAMMSAATSPSKAKTMDESGEVNIDGKIYRSNEQLFTEKVIDYPNDVISSNDPQIQNQLTAKLKESKRRELRPGDSILLIIDKYQYQLIMDVYNKPTVFRSKEFRDGQAKVEVNS